MEKIEDILNNYYKNSYNEDIRLIKDKAHSIEFITTTTYIDKYLKPADRLLEIGAGTGRYSIYYANKGYSVNSVELLDTNILTFKEKVKDNMNISIHKGNAIDLNMFNDNTFNVTLVLGPMYHLFTESDKTKAISEAIRVTKKDGIIIFAYISNDAIILNYGVLKGNLKEINSKSDKNFKLINTPEKIFNCEMPNEFKNRMQNFNIKFIKQVAADGLTQVVSDKINDLSAEEFKIWTNYHLANCEREDLLGYSNHILYICKKL